MSQLPELEPGEMAFWVARSAIVVCLKLGLDSVAGVAGVAVGPAEAGSGVKFAKPAWAPVDSAAKRLATAMARYFFCIGCSWLAN